MHTPYHASSEPSADARRIFASLELSKATWVVALQLPTTDKVSGDQGISKAGNRRVRTIAIELAWIWLRNQSDSRLSRWFHSRVGAAAGRLRRITIVALARKLIVALWRFLAADVVPDGAVVR